MIRPTTRGHSARLYAEPPIAIQAGPRGRGSRHEGSLKSFGRLPPVGRRYQYRAAEERSPCSE